MATKKLTMVKGTWVEIGKEIVAADYMHENK